MTLAATFILHTGLSVYQRSRSDGIEKKKLNYLALNILEAAAITQELAGVLYLGI